MLNEALLLSLIGCIEEAMKERRMSLKAMAQWQQSRGRKPQRFYWDVYCFIPADIQEQWEFDLPDEAGDELVYRYIRAACSKLGVVYI
jgi:hypothetical protein